MVKVTVLYGHPQDADAFEKYYAERHTPIAVKIPAMEQFELTKFYPNPDGSPPAHYRTADLYFKDMETLTACLNSEEGKAAASDLANFATGGVTFLVGGVEYVTLNK